MIDIENAVYTQVSTALKAAFPKINITGDPVASPSEFPCVSIFEADNFVHSRSQDSGSNENYVNVMYEVYVFSNKKASRKSECKDIFQVADNVLLSMGFTRISKTPILDSEGKKYQLIGRYEAVISKEKIIFRR